MASNDGGFSKVLRVGDGGIVLQDSKTALVTLDPAKAFGGSAFGPLRFRPVSAEGVAGDWQPLATLVRVPDLKELKCAAGAPLCTLVGTNLFLLDQVGADAQLADAVTVPEGFGATTLDVPRPNGTLYLKLRDDPAVVNTAVSARDSGGWAIRGRGADGQPNAAADSTQLTFNRLSALATKVWVPHSSLLLA